MTTNTGKHRRSRAILAAVLGTAIVIGCSGIGNAADEDEGESLGTKVFNDFMHALGLRRGDDNGINYRERSPLVLPNSAQLPPPEKNAPAATTANWPDDPDVKRAKAMKEAERKKTYINPEEVGPLLPSQYSIARPASRGRSDGKSAASPEDSMRPMSPYELGSKNPLTSIWASKEEYLPFTGEPPRTSLTEPPAGYRTPSPSQPYGVGPQEWKPTVVDRNLPTR
jgi:hypothetical protein